MPPEEAHATVRLTGEKLFSIQSNLGFVEISPLLLLQSLVVPFNKRENFPDHLNYAIQDIKENTHTLK